MLVKLSDSVSEFEMMRQEPSIETQELIAACLDHDLINDAIMERKFILIDELEDELSIMFYTILAYVIMQAIFICICVCTPIFIVVSDECMYECPCFGICRNMNSNFRNAGKEAHIYFISTFKDFNWLG